MSVPSLQEVVRTVASINGNNVSRSISLFGIPLEFFIILVVIVGLAIASGIVVAAIKKPKPMPLGKAFEEAMQQLELTGIKGIGSKRSEELKAVGVNTVSDLATSSAKDLSQKTGISEKIISRWIVQAKEIIE